MPSRPQFSLSLLLFVTAMVCLAAATFHRAPPKEWLGGDEQWEELGFAVHVQARLRLAVCVVFPSALVAAAVARGGYGRAFCLGALLPAAIPLVLVSSTAVYLRGGAVVEVFMYLSVVSHMLSERIAALWLSMPCVGFVRVVADWFLPMPSKWDAAARQSFLVRVALMTAVAGCASAAIIALPTSAPQIGASANVWHQLPFRLLLSLALPAVLGVGAVQHRGFVRAFCASGLLPALVPAVLVSGSEFLESQFDGQWESAQMFECRYFILTMWVLVPLFGLTAVFFYWLFQLGAAKSNRTDDAVEKPG